MGHIVYGSGIEDGTSSHDDWAIEPTFYWNWGERRGLSKFNRNKETGYWEEEGVTTNTDMKSWEGVKMLFHKGHLYIRHAEVADQPFE